MKNVMNKVFILTCITGLLVSCSSGTPSPTTDPGSSDLAARINFNYLALADGDGTTVFTATLTKATNTSSMIVLEPTEEIRVEAYSELAGSTVFVLELDEAKYGAGIYGATFDTQEGGLSFQISYEDGASFESLGTTAELPDDFSITAPLLGADYDSDATVTMTFDALETSPLYLTFQAVCTENEVTTSASKTISSEQQVSLSFVPDNLMEDTGFVFSGTCYLNITAFLDSEGTLDSLLLGGGEIVARQSRFVQIDIIP